MWPRLHRAGTPIAMLVFAFVGCTSAAPTVDTNKTFLSELVDTLERDGPVGWQEREMIKTTDQLISLSDRELDAVLDAKTAVRIGALLADPRFLDRPIATLALTKWLSLSGPGAKQALPSAVKALEAADARWPPPADRALMMGPPDRPANICTALGFITGENPDRFGSCAFRNYTWPTFPDPVTTRAAARANRSIWP